MSAHISSSPAWDCRLGVTPYVIDGSYGTLFGPLPWSVMEELVMRARSIRVTGTLTMDDPETDGGPYECDVTLIRVGPTADPEVWPPTTDEIDVMRDLMGDDGMRSPGSTGPVFRMVSEAGEDPASYFAPAQWLWDEGTDYWFQGGFIASPDSPYFATNLGTAGGPDEFTANLVIRGDSYPIQLQGNILGTTTCTIEIDGWFPYATSAGDPAWDSATGEPINGGPGA